jgi:hypothetical protein
MYLIQDSKDLLYVVIACLLHPLADDIFGLVYLLSGNDDAGIF